MGGISRRKRINNKVINATVCIENLKDLSARQLEILLSIIEICDRNNILRDMDGDAITNLDNVAAMIRLSAQNEPLKELSKKYVIRRCRVNGEWMYLLNPYIAYVGSSVMPEVYMAFKETKYRYVYGEDYFEEVLV